VELLEDKVKITNKNFKKGGIKLLDSQQENNEQSIKNEFLECFEIFREAKKKKEQEEQKPYMMFDYNAFNNATNSTNRLYDSLPRKYTKENVRNYLANPEKFERQVKELSIFLYVCSSEYKSFIDYRGKMLTHDFVLLPDGFLGDNSADKKLLNSFYLNLEFLENYNIKSKFSSIESILLREDIYFGYERSDGENFNWQRLPNNYCRIEGYDSFGCFSFEFDFSYFNNKSVDIDNFEPEFKVKYDVYKTSKSNKRWQKLDTSKAVCFKFDQSVLYALPYLSGIFPQLMGLEDYKDIQEESTRANNYKLITFEIPMKTGSDARPDQFLVTEPQKFHANAKSNIPTGVAVLTTPFKSSVINLNNSQFDDNVVAKAENDIYTMANISKLIGNGGESSMGLERSINNDESLLFNLLRQYELWLKKRLRLFNASLPNRFRWRIELLDTTIYNRDKVFEKYLKSGTSGFNKFYITSSLGISQHSFLGLAKLENKLLNLVDDMLKVLPSSATTSGNDVGGNPGKDISNKKDISIKGDDLETNKSKTFEEDEDIEDIIE